MSQFEFDPERERAFVAGLLRGNPAERASFSERLSCVLRILRARNARSARPLDHEDFNDLVQDTFLVIWRKLPDYRPHAPLESWIHGICCLQLKSARRTIARRQDRVQKLSEEILAEASDAPSFDLSEVHVLLGRLGGMEAEVIRLKHLEGLTFEELSGRLELSRNTAKTLYYRGIATLRDITAKGRHEGCRI